MKKLILAMGYISILASCKTVGPQDRVFLSDSEMQLAMKKCEKMELNFMLYREGSSGATGGKSGGGCGCN
jgi:hypothetical protein